MQFTVRENLIKRNQSLLFAHQNNKVTPHTKNATISPKQLKRLYPKWTGMAKAYTLLKQSLKPSIVTVIISQLKITPVNTVTEKLADAFLGQTCRFTMVQLT